MVLDTYLFSLAEVSTKTRCLQDDVQGMSGESGLVTNKNKVNFRLFPSAQHLQGERYDNKEDK